MWGGQGCVVESVVRSNKVEVIHKWWPESPSLLFGTLFNLQDSDKVKWVRLVSLHCSVKPLVINLILTSLIIKFLQIFEFAWKLVDFGEHRSHRVVNRIFIIEFIVRITEDTIHSKLFLKWLLTHFLAKK